MAQLRLIKRAICEANGLAVCEANTSGNIDDEVVAEDIALQACASCVSRAMNIGMCSPLICFDHASGFSSSSVVDPCKFGVPGKRLCIDASFLK